jgi:deaminated glutathione amidase
VHAFERMRAHVVTLSGWEGSDLSSAPRRACSAHKVWLSLGGFQESEPDTARVYNSHVIVSTSGAIAAVYRKVHLFDVAVEGGPVYRESDYTAPGQEVRCASEPRQTIL